MTAILAANLMSVARVTTLSQVLSSTSDVGGTISYPGGVQFGDLAFLCDWSRWNSGTPTKAIPAPFTEIITDNNTGTNSQLMSLSYRLLDGAESGALPVSNGTGLDAKVMVVFRGNVPIRGVTISTPTSSGVASGNPAAQNILASGGTPPLVALGCYGSSGVVNPRTFTVAGSPAKDGEVGEPNDEHCYVAWKIYNSSPANVSIDMDDEGSQIMMGLYIAVR